jgi:hypothetical protein
MSNNLDRKMSKINIEKKNMEKDNLERKKYRNVKPGKQQIQKN